MKRLFLILLVTALVAAGGYFAAFHLMAHGTPTQCLMNQPDCGMQWLKSEYHLTDAQYAKIAQMHSDYRPTCDLLCARVATANEKLNELIAASPVVTPEIEAELKEWALLQNDCRVAMLRHVYAVAAEMKPEEGRRYIQMATARIAAPGMDHAALLSK
ncbi:MAG: Spy/CpxP family protein refolding chaperone [Chthoniobacteraceae bacterium]